MRMQTKYWREIMYAYPFEKITSIGISVKCLMCLHGSCNLCYNFFSNTTISRYWPDLIKIIMITLSITIIITVLEVGVIIVVVLMMMMMITKNLTILQPNYSKQFSPQKTFNFKQALSCHTHKWERTQLKHTTNSTSTCSFPLPSRVICKETNHCRKSENWSDARKCHRYVLSE